MTKQNVLPIRPPKISKQERMAIYRRLLTYVFRFKGRLAICLLLTVASNLLALLGPLLSGYAVDAIAIGPGQIYIPTVMGICGLMALFYAASAGLSYLLSVLMIDFSRRISYAMRKEVFEHLLRLPAWYFDRNQTGDIISHISYDIDTINTSLSNDLLHLLTGSITIIGCLIAMIFISPLMLSVFVVTVPMSILLTKHRTKKVRPLFRRRSAKLGELNGYTEEMLSGEATIRAYHKQDIMIHRFDHHNTEAVDAYYDADYQGSMLGPSMNALNNLSLALIGMLGAVLYLQELTSLGSISSFILYSRRFFGPINELANIVGEIQSATSAAARVFKLLDAPAEKADAPNAIPLQNVLGEIEFRHVDFGYTPDKPVLKDFCLKVEPGQTVAIVGPTGAGKTTVINLLMRFYDPVAGEICIDGQPLESLTRQSLRKAFTMVLQDTWLFGGTVYENIAYGKAGAKRQQVIDAAKAAHVHDFILSLPDGYDTVISEDAGNISSGQKQLFTIARAFLCDAPLLILDEATSNVDSRTEIFVTEAMNRLMEQKTCIVIAHRLSTIQHADKIVVLGDGKIIESGNHEQLLQQGGFYASLFQAQFD